MADEPTRPANFGGRRSVSLHEAMEEASPSTHVTPFLLIANVLLFIVMVASGVDYREPTVQQLLEWGGSFPPLTVNGDYYRLLTTTFIHIGAVHLLLNMWCLYQLGFLVEKLYGSLSFAIVYLVSGLGGSVLASIVSPEISAAGASGAIFGLGGAWLAFVLVQKDTISPDFYRSSINNIGFFLGLNLIFGLSVSGISNAGHIGGLIAGFGSGFFLTRVLYPLAEPSNARRAVVLGVALAILTGGVFVAQWRVSQLAPAQINNDYYKDVIGRYLDDVKLAAAGLGEVELRLTKIEERLLNGQAVDKEDIESAAVAMKDFRVKFESINTELEELQEMHRLRSQQLKYLEELCEYYQTISQKGDPVDLTIAKDLKEKSIASETQFREKFKTLLGRYGLRLVKSN